MTDTILGNFAFRPILNHLVFIRVDANRLANELAIWQLPLIREFGNSFKTTVGLSANMPNCVLSLCPLNTVEIRRYLLIPTVNEWTIFIDNGHMGTDRTAPEVLCKRLDTECIYVLYEEKEEQALFEYYKAGELNRFVGVTKESGWKFHNYGNALPFEDTASYKNKTIKKRLNRLMLSNYLSNFGIAVDDPTYYDTDHAILIDKLGGKFEATRDLTLLEAQHFFK